MNQTERLCKFLMDSSHQLKLHLDSMLEDTDLTGQHVRILGFVAHSDEMGRAVYQKDIEAAFKIRRSSVSNVLDTMEKNGYIRRLQSQTDTRLKKIVLTDKAKETGVQHRKKIARFDDRIESDLTPEEIETMKRLFNKVLENAMKMRGETND